MAATRPPDGNGRFNRFGFLTPSINEHDQIAFYAQLRDLGIDGRGATGFFVGGPGSTVRQVAREDEPAPGGGAFSTLLAERLPALDRFGRTAFFAVLQDTAGGPADNSGIYLHEPSTGLTEIAREGGLLPDGSGRYLSGISSPLLNDAGTLVFSANYEETLSDAAGNAMLQVNVDTAEQTVLLRSGEDAPSGDGVISSFGIRALNDANQLAVAVSLTDVVGPAGRSELLFYDPTTGLHSIARTGIEFLGSTLTIIDVNGGEILSDNGQVAYRFELADGRSGIAVWTLPEPNAIALLTAAGLTLLRRRPALAVDSFSLSRRRK
ncbi:MAG: choice-of-anchor tandem repeat NxxGxxAF-containing protein [Planctomycetota bacterium]